MSLRKSNMEEYLLQQIQIMSNTRILISKKMEEMGNIQGPLQAVCARSIEKLKKQERALVNERFRYLEKFIIGWNYKKTDNTTLVRNFEMFISYCCLYLNSEIFNAEELHLIQKLSDLVTGIPTESITYDVWAGLDILL
jgi:hypothetical protein